MKPVRTFTVIPRLPAEIERLRDLACNLRWAWDSEAIELFRRLSGTVHVTVTIAEYPGYFVYPIPPGGSPACSLPAILKNACI